MTIQDFSNGFDVLLNSYSQKIEEGNQVSRADIAFDEYEKSVYLTKAQEGLVLGLYNGKNVYGESFETTEELRRYLSNLVADTTLEPIENSSGVAYGVDSSSKFFTLPDNLWFITYESVNVSGKKCDTDTIMDVYPVTQDEYSRTKRNPFRGANSRRALRLDLADGVIEIVCKYQVNSYYVRYIRKPKPILLVDLDDNDSNVSYFQGETRKQGCELHDALHQRILESAVRLALQSKVPQIKKE